jgi:hypothetical protein
MDVTFIWQATPSLHVRSASRIWYRTFPVQSITSRTSQGNLARVLPVMMATTASDGDGDGDSDGGGKRKRPRLLQ